MNRASLLSLLLALPLVSAPAWAQGSQDASSPENQVDQVAINERIRFNIESVNTPAQQVLVAGLRDAHRAGDRRQLQCELAELTQETVRQATLHSGLTSGLRERISEFVAVYDLLPRRVRRDHPLPVHELDIEPGEVTRLNLGSRPIRLFVIRFWLRT